LEVLHRDAQEKISESTLFPDEKNKNNKNHPESIRPSCSMISCHDYPTTLNQLQTRQWCPKAYNNLPKFSFLSHFQKQLEDSITLSVGTRQTITKKPSSVYSKLQQ
jgi:hypothetical protein